MAPSWSVVCRVVGSDELQDGKNLRKWRVGVQEREGAVTLRQKLHVNG